MEKELLASSEGKQENKRPPLPFFDIVEETLLRRGYGLTAIRVDLERGTILVAGMSIVFDIKK